MNIMKQFISIVIIISITTTCSVSQTIFVGWGPVHSHTKQTEKLVNGKDAFFYSYNQKILGFEYLCKNFSSIVSFSKYKVVTDMRVADRYYVGYYGTDVTRLDIGLSYNLIKPHKFFFVKPFFAAGLQFARHRADIWGEQIHIYGPNYFQTEYPTSRGRNNFQIVPGLGVKAGVKFLKRMEFGVCIQGVYGYKQFQELSFKYTYKNELTERTAKFQSNGTGLYSSFFLGVSLKKYNK